MIGDSNGQLGSNVKRSQWLHDVVISRNRDVEAHRKDCRRRSPLRSGGGAAHLLTSLKEKLIKIGAKSQISSSTIVRAARAAGSHPHLASVLQQGRKSTNIRVSLGVIRGIPAKMITNARSS